MADLSTLTAEARRRDAADPRFGRPGAYLTSGIAHLNGNSLGPPRASLSGELERAVSKQWARRQVGAWFREGWLDLPRSVGDKLAVLLGAGPGQIVVAGETTSTTLFNVLTAACRLRDDRSVLLAETGAFPTDLYIAASVSTLLGRRLHVVPGTGIETFLREEGHRVAVALLAPVDFRTGERRDVAAATAGCHAAGAVTVWDLSHAAGILPVRLDGDEVDLAVGCGYKYLGGGPGAPAFAYVARRWQSRVDFPLSGWHGHAEPFALRPEFEPASGIDRARTGTPSVLGLLALNHALDPLLDVGTEALYGRNRSLAEFFLDCLEYRNPGLLSHLITPREPERRGGHLAFRVPDADAAAETLRERGVLVDARPPDLLRFAFAPLYVTHEHVVRAASGFCDLLEGLS